MPTASKLRVRIRRAVLACLAVAWAGIAWHQTHKPLPAGVHLASATCAGAELGFIADITAADAFGHGVMSQGIFDAVLALVREARRFVVIDYRTFSDVQQATLAGEPAARHLAEELTQELIARHAAVPQLQVLVITDPAAEDYGARTSPALARLRDAGFTVITTNLERLRDSNPAYSGLWRLLVRWWDPPGASFGSTLRRLNFKANERRVIIADDGRGGLAAVLGSANPSDITSSWSNVAVRIAGSQVAALLASELAVARFSGWRASPEALAGPAAGADCPVGPTRRSGPTVQLLTEGAVREALLTHLDATLRGDEIDVAMYRIADRAVIESLLAAARRGVNVRLILDPNETRSSGALAGIPNQVVASELVSKSDGALRVRWYRTHGERFHSALVMVYERERAWLLAGSATLTGRSLGDFNLAADAAIGADRGAPLARQVQDYFDTLWNNRAAQGMEYTADFPAFAESSQYEYWLYRLLEASGFSEF